MNFDKFFRALGKGMKAAAKATAAQSKPAKPTSFPVMVPDMLTPADKVFTRAETIKLYTMFMLEIGYLERGDIDLDSIEFGDQMDFFEQELKDNVELLAGELQSQKEYATQEKADIRSDELSRAEMKEALQEVDKEVAGAKAALDTAKQALAAFKANRRGYLVAYVNNQVHGTPMPPEFTNVAPT